MASLRIMVNAPTKSYANTIVLLRQIDAAIHSSSEDSCTVALPQSVAVNLVEKFPLEVTEDAFEPGLGIGIKLGRLDLSSDEFIDLLEQAGYEVELVRYSEIE